MRILIAEDDAETAGFVEQGLGELGHNVVVAGNGEDALHLGLTEKFDLLILDRMIPRLDGLTVLKRLHAAEIATPALMLTALGRIEDRVAGLDTGADDYPVKPFAFSELVARVHALGRRRAPQMTETRLKAGAVEMDLLARSAPRRRRRPASARGIPAARRADAPCRRICDAHDVA